MSNMKYCPSCKRNVNAEHSWSVAVLILLVLVGWVLLWIPLIIYVVWKWKRRCPICKTPESMMYAPRFDDVPAPIVPGQGPQSPQQPFP